MYTIVENSLTKSANRERKPCILEFHRINWVGIVLNKFLKMSSESEVNLNKF